MDPSTATNDERGELLCRSCSAHSTVAVSNAVIADRDPASTRNLYGAAAASALLGTVTCCLTGVGAFFFLFCPISMFIGVATIYRVLRDEVARRALGDGLYVVIGLSVYGALVGGLGTLLGLLGMMGAGLGYR
jgi:hypothetical protein